MIYLGKRCQASGTSSGTKGRLGCRQATSTTIMHSFPPHCVCSSCKDQSYIFREHLSQERQLLMLRPSSSPASSKKPSRPQESSVPFCLPVA